MSVTYITRNLPENEIRFSKIIWEQYNQKININTAELHFLILRFVYY